MLFLNGDIHIDGSDNYRVHLCTIFYIILGNRNERVASVTIAISELQIIS